MYPGVHVALPTLPKYILHYSKAINVRKWINLLA